jgi:CubicO group peptidase (beta-lactamase class C family)
LDGLTEAPAIHWSAKTGNASVCTTARDEARFVRELIRGPLLSEASQRAMFDEAVDTGYGWFKGATSRLGERAYRMNGRAPGFSSFVVYVPGKDLTVVALSNVYSSATTPMGYDVARIALGRKYEPLRVGAGLSPAGLRSFEGTFQFGGDFYQKNARLTLKATGSYLSLVWPAGGGESALIPVAEDEFRDRGYWETIRIERDSAGSPAALRYGEFRGTVVRRD